MLTVKLRWVGDSKSSYERGPSWGLYCRAGTRDFCSALAAPVASVENIFFLTIHYFNSYMVPSPIKLGGQPGWVACLLVCVSALQAGGSVSGATPVIVTEPRTKHRLEIRKTIRRREEGGSDSGASPSLAAKLWTKRLFCACRPDMKKMMKADTLDMTHTLTVAPLPVLRRNVELQ